MIGLVIAAQLLYGHVSYDAVQEVTASLPCEVVFSETWINCGKARTQKRRSELFRQLYSESLNWKQLDKAYKAARRVGLI
jgi:hypothetical protein